MTEPTDDFATMFAASVQPKRIEKGQTAEGTIVAIGPEVALVDVGGKSEATIDIDVRQNFDVAPTESESSFTQGRQRPNLRGRITRRSC